LNSIDVSRAITATLDAGGHDARLPEALIYEYRPLITRVVEYGASADAVLSGQAPPVEGARFDFYLEGPVSGHDAPRNVQGRGLHLLPRRRPRQVAHSRRDHDGDGKKIALEAGGVALAEVGSPLLTCQPDRSTSRPTAS